MCPAEAINYAIGPFDVLRRLLLLLLPVLCLVGVDRMIYLDQRLVVEGIPSAKL